MIAVDSPRWNRKSGFGAFSRIDDGLRVRRVDPLDHREVRLVLVRALGIGGALEREPDRLRRERLAIVELHARAQLEREGPDVGRDGPALGQQRRDRPILADLDQRLEHVVVNHLADRRRRAGGRIEPVGLERHRHHDRVLLRLGERARRGNGRGDRNRAGQQAMGLHPDLLLCCRRPRAAASANYCTGDASAATSADGESGRPRGGRWRVPPARAASAWQRGAARGQRAANEQPRPASGSAGRAGGAIGGAAAAPARRDRGRRRLRRRPCGRPPRASPRGVVGARDRVEQRTRVRMRRRPEQVLRAALLDDAPPIDHRDLVADVVDDGQVVADQQVGDAESVLQVLQQVQHLRLHGDVQRTDRLVGHDELRVA